MNWYQNDDNKVLIWKINDKEIGILSIRANINNKFSIKNLRIEIYDNLLIPNFIKVVNYKRQLISKKKKRIELKGKSQERIRTRNNKIWKINQRIFSKIYIWTRTDYNKFRRARKNLSKIKNFHKFNKWYIKG